MKHEVKPEQVPDVVWSAFCEAVYKYGYGPHALAAALNAWPGMKACEEDDLGPACLILPLMETRDDE